MKRFAAANWGKLQHFKQLDKRKIVSETPGKGQKFPKVAQKPGAAHGISLPHNNRVALSACIGYDRLQGLLCARIAA